MGRVNTFYYFCRTRLKWKLREGMEVQYSLMQPTGRMCTDFPFFVVVVDPSGHGRRVAAVITQFDDVYLVKRGLLEFKKANMDEDL